MLFPHNAILDLLYPWITMISILLIARHFEKRFPLERKQSTAEIILDWKLVGTEIVLNKMLIAPIVAISGAMTIKALGGGWIHLRSDGGWFLISVIVVILTLDFLSYWIHRAQHKFSVLWAMHSFHHSAEAITAVTGGRHFWFEAITGAVPVAAIVFAIPPEVMVLVMWLYLLPDGLAHTNVRVQLGRFGLWLNNPQYHRIHHSIEPQHRDKNFCKMLPLFDVIFGTAYKPSKDEFPVTGLVPTDRPAGIIDGIIWPLRHLLSRKMVLSLPRISS